MILLDILKYRIAVKFPDKIFTKTQDKKVETQNVTCSRLANHVGVTIYKF